MSTESNDGRISVPRFAPPWDVADAMRKSLRGMEHLSVGDIAQQLGVSRNTVGNWLNGRVEPDERTLIAWAQITAVPYRWLVSFKKTGGPVRSRFTPEEMESFKSEAASRGITVSMLLREHIQPPIPEEELELLDTETLREMWFENHRIYIAQKEDTGPRKMADSTSLYSPVMSTRLEKVLNAREVYPALELNRIEDRLAMDSPE